MAHIAFLLDDGFEDSEFRRPYDDLLTAGHDIVVLGSEKGRTVEGKEGDEFVVLDDAVSAHDPAEFDALVIPGGHAPDHLRLVDGAVNFVRGFAKTGRPLAAVCHGPQLLISADVVDGRTLTSWPSIRVDLENAGARWIDWEVVTDGSLITSRKPDDLSPFSNALIEQLREVPAAAVR